MVKSKFLGDILTDDTGKYFDLGAAVTFCLGIALIFLSAYDEYMGWKSYNTIVAHLLTLTPTPAIPPSPNFNAQNFGIAGGAIISALGAHKWLSKSTDGNETVESDKPGGVV